MYSLLVAGLLFAFAGCGGKKPQVMELSLDSNPTTGYSWTVSQSPELFDVSEEYVENAHEKGMTGVGGQQVFRLSPKSSGTAEVTFVYARPWEDPEADSTVIAYTVDVSKDLQINVTGSKSAGGSDINSLPQIPEPVIR